MNVADGRFPLDETLGFVLRVDAAFCPQIGAHFGHRIRAWAQAQQVETAGEEAIAES